ncbi:uncharacterized protein [Haliotis asinina]|uniref:uncharacterized protein n=1 Tax=Haliotis asinina TaxID=109174 RepID=UPI00353243EF
MNSTERISQAGKESPIPNVPENGRVALVPEQPQNRRKKTQDPKDIGRKWGVPETGIHGVSADAVSAANTANCVHGGMGNTYNYFYPLGRQEEVITAMISQLGIGTQIDNVHKPQDITMSERKSRVRLDSESDKQVMVEDHSPQHGQQSVTDVAKVVAAETATEATLIAVTETATGDASDAPAEGSTGDSSASGNDGEPPNNIKPSWVSALYRSMGILFRGRNTSQLKECLPGLEIREPDLQLQSNGLSLVRCNEKADHENTEGRIEEDAVYSTSIVHNEVIPRASSDSGDAIH